MLDVIAAVVGVFGTCLNAVWVKPGYKVLAFMLWGISNAVMVAYCVQTRQWWIAAMQGVYFVASMLGIYTHWDAYQKEKRRPKRCQKIG